MKYRLLGLLAAILATTSSSFAQLYWVGGGAPGPNSLFQQTNWSGTGTIGSGTTNADLVIGAPGSLSNGQIVSNKNPGGNGASTTLNTAGHNVTIVGNKLAFLTTLGIQAASSPSGPVADLTLEGYDKGTSIVGAELDTKFIVGFDVSVDQFSTINIFGNVTPINQSVIDLTSIGGAGSVVTFENGLPSQFGTDLSSADFGSVFRVDGQPAVQNVNLQVAQVGATLVLTAIPEPGDWWITALLLGFVILVRRRRREPEA